MSHPRFNHVAMSVPAELLSEEGAKQLVDFYGEVFGWEEMPTMTEPGRLLVLKVHTFTQFVYLHADEEPMVAHRRDHAGLQVETLEEFDRVLTRARGRAGHDGVTEVIGPQDETFGPVRLRSFYVRHRLPLMWEIQHFDVTPSAP
jgi:catechol 2,3-dioxygenase-like lactoylglutathione lyase family enzyme